MNKKSILSFSTAAVIVFSFSAGSVAQSADYTTAVQDKVWIEDMENKVDSTIKVLSVIKQELEEEKNIRQQPADTSPDAWVDNLRKSIKRIKRLWAELKKIREEDIQQPGAAQATTPQDAAKWASDMQDKLDKSIKAMQVIKEELDAMDKDNK